MNAKNLLIGLFILFLLFAGGVLLFVAATGFIQIPVLSSLLGTDRPRDLGVKYDPALFDRMLENNGVELTAPKTRYCLNYQMTYSNTGPMDVTLSSEELTSYLRATNEAEGTLKNLQVKLGDSNTLEASAMVDLKKYGYDWSGPIYAKGSIHKAGKSRIRLAVEKSEAGIVPIPGEYTQKGKDELERTINGQLAGMTGLTIDELSIEGGKLHYKGNFPKRISA